MTEITSRKNEYIRHLRLLASDKAYRAEQGEFVCDGYKMLLEAIQFGAEIKSVLWKDGAKSVNGLDCKVQYVAPTELFDYASTMKNSPGPLFAVAIPDGDKNKGIHRAIVLEGVQDPGNVGTVIRTANAFGIDAVILTGDCADLYNPKTVRSTMGAIFRQRVISCTLDELAELLDKNALPMYGAALSDKALSILDVNVKNAAVAVGSEGRGLSGELLEICKNALIIPMQPDSESLNAAVAASVIMWEMAR
ncbi:MAG: RNA methyltransferase [Oscillospiraceae bacterium]|nr:RNA methyltransferase [Oscillospiraceae bacterium]